MQSCNDMARNYGDKSDAFYRRLIIMRFSKPVPPEKHDPNLKEKLSEERDGILLWAIEGLKRLIANNYQFSETDRTKAELAEYKTSNSSALGFVEECCELDSSSEILSEDLYAAYLEYCSDNGHKPTSQTKFNGDLDGVRGLERSRETTTSRKTWRGIHLV